MTSIGACSTGQRSISLWAPLAWLSGGVARRVRVDVAAGRITRVESNTEPAAADLRCDGMLWPGAANTHSHAFHRALRGRTHVSGTFWTWRTAMYRVASRLTPDSLYELARATYAEMLLAGYTSVGEFHYLHQRPDGQPYDDPNAMGRAVLAAARDAGIRITLLDACYLAGGLGQPIGHEQRRFSDGDAASWAARVTRLADTVTRDDVAASRDDDAVTGDGDTAPTALVGAAIHSVRAVPPDQIGTVARWALDRGCPLHVHVSEQRAENESTLAELGLTPTELLAQRGALGPATTLVHGIHLTDGDIRAIAESDAGVCLCPTTERDLGDGIAPAAALSAAGVSLSVGSDQHVEIDAFAEARAVEADERLAAEARGVFTPSRLWEMAAVNGYRALGWPDGGHIVPGALADLVTVRTDTPRTAGADPAQLVMAAGATDVEHVLVAGQLVVRCGTHRLGDVGELLANAIGPLWHDAAGA